MKSFTSFAARCTSSALPMLPPYSFISSSVGDSSAASPLSDEASRSSSELLLVPSPEPSPEPSLERSPERAWRERSSPEADFCPSPLSASFSPLSSLSSSSPPLPSSSVLLSSCAGFSASCSIWREFSSSCSTWLSFSVWRVMRPFSRIVTAKVPSPLRLMAIYTDCPSALRRKVALSPFHAPDSDTSTATASAFFMLSPRRESSSGVISLASRTPAPVPALSAESAEEEEEEAPVEAASPAEEAVPLSCALCPAAVRSSTFALISASTAASFPLKLRITPPAQSIVASARVYGLLTSRSISTVTCAPKNFVA